MEDDESKEEYQIEDALENYDNKEFMMKAVEDGATWVIAYASDRLHADRELMLKGVSKDGQLLYYASKELRDDKEIVMNAVKNKWRIIKYASKKMRNDKDIAIEAIKQNKESAMYLTDEIKKAPEVEALIKGENA